jgi:hypothetical protein
MRKITLYRGITLNENDVDKVVDNIKFNGLNIVKECQWSGFVWKDLRNDIQEFLKKQDLSTDETRPRSIWVETEKGNAREYTEGYKGLCFADRYGANYYAFQHNMTPVNTVPVVITAEVDISSVAVDGRDFLYTIFGFIDREDQEKTRRQIQILSKLFGDKISIYVNKVINHPKSDPFTICDLAIIDDDIIVSHLNNQYLINGRYKTKFRSAFYVRTPIKPTSIKEIKINEFYSEEPLGVVSLDDILEL